MDNGLFRTYLKKRFLALLLLLALGLVFSCSNKAGLVSDMSGKWQRDQGKGPMEIDLVNASKTVVMDGKSYHVDVLRIDKMSNTIQVEVDLDTGKSEIWSFHQVWNLSEKSFNLTFIHNGATETLMHADQS